MPTDNETPFAFAPTSIMEQEVVVRLNRATGMAHISSCWPTWTARLVKRYGRPHHTAISQAGDQVVCAFWNIPLRLITFRKPSRRGARNPAGLEKAQEVRQAGRLTREALKTS